MAEPIQAEPTQAQHDVARSLAVTRGGVDLLTYRYGDPGTPTSESPRPYLHPIRTLGGVEVSVFRPDDHPWHHGLSMTCAELSGENFWGGPTYATDSATGERGYRDLDNHGTQRHAGIESFDPTRPAMIHRVAWVTRGGERWIDERRSLDVIAVGPSEGYWAMRLRFELTNASGQTLGFGSPTTAGRPNAGYGSLFWRGPAAWSPGARLFTASGAEGEAAMGRRAAWLACATPPEAEAPATVVLVDDPTNPRHPTPWFARATPYACAAPAFMFDEVCSLPADATLPLTYRLIVGDGAWSAERVEACVAAIATA